MSLLDPSPGARTLSKHFYESVNLTDLKEIDVASSHKAIRLLGQCQVDEFGI